MFFDRESLSVCSEEFMSKFITEMNPSLTESNTKMLSQYVIRIHDPVFERLNYHWRKRYG